jgi:hypothetical protein
MKCSNCNSAITCGCQKRVASDGKQVCTSCLQAYEEKIKIQRSNYGFKKP